MEIVTNIIRAVVFFNSVYMPFFILYRHFDSYGALKDFNNIITEQNKTIAKLNSRVERLEKEKWNPYRQIWDLRMQLYQMEQSIESNFTERLSFLENSTTGAIAFQAYYGDRDIIPVNIGEGSVVTFSDVPLNHGKGFNCSSGTFVVPASYSGLYLFSMHLLVQNGEYPPFQLRRGNYSDSITLCNAVSSHANMLLGDTPGSQGDVQVRLGQSTVSCSVLADAKEGDRIYVWYPSKNYIPLSTQPQQSSFSGLFVKSRQKVRENENIYY